MTFEEDIKFQMTKKLNCIMLKEGFKNVKHGHLDQIKGTWVRHWSKKAINPNRISLKLTFNSRIAAKGALNHRQQCRAACNTIEANFDQSKNDLMEVWQSAILKRFLFTFFY